MRTVCVVTGDRSELGLLRPIMKRIHADKGLRLRRFVCKWHFSELHGTAKELRRDGMPFEKIRGEEFGEIFSNLKKKFEKGDMDFVLIVGDREAAFAAAYAAALTGIPVAHVHGGDRTDSGHIDEAVRHSITRFAHIHFAACRSSARRLRDMGEQTFRIRNVGTPVIDAYLDIIKKRKITLKEVLGKNKLKIKGKYILCMQHPVSHEREEAGVQMEITLAALEKTGLPSIVIYPNGDPGTGQMVDVIELYRKFPWVHVRRSIHHDDFCVIFKNAAVVVGNSSAGLIEGSYFKTPAVNIGRRNMGRECGSNVIFVKNHSIRAVTEAMEKALSPGFRRRARRGPDPYGRGKASEKIVNVLKTIRIDDRLTRKKITF